MKKLFSFYVFLVFVLPLFAARDTIQFENDTSSSIWLTNFTWTATTTPAATVSGPSQAYGANVSPTAGYNVLGTISCSGTNGQTLNVTYSYYVKNVGGVAVVPSVFVSGSSSATISGTADTTVIVPLQTTATPTCVTNVNFSLQNNDVGDHTYFLSDIRGLCFGVVPALLLAPGGKGVLSESVNCADAPYMAVFQMSDNLTNYYTIGTPVPNGSGGWNAAIQQVNGGDNGDGLTGSPTGTPDWGSSASGNDGSGNAGGVPPTIPPWSNLPPNPPINTSGPTTGVPTPGDTNILWSSSTTTATTGDGTAIVAAIKDAASTLYDVASKAAANANNAASQAHSDAQQIAGDVTSGSGSIVSAIRAGSTNSLSLTGVATEHTAEAGTNLMGMQLASLSGIANTLSNLTDVTNMDIASESTLAGVSNLIASGLAGTNGTGFRPTNYATESTLEGISNLLGGGSNGVLAGFTNALTLAQLTNQSDVYQAALSNTESDVMSQISSLTNQAGQMAMGSVADAVAASGSLAVQYSGSVGITPSPIDLGHGVEIQLGSSMPSYGPLRQILAWATIVGLFIANWRTTYDRIRDVLASEQAYTAGTSVLGTNVNYASSLAMAAAIFALVTAIPTFAVAVLSGEVSLYVSLGGPLAMLSSGLSWGYSFLDQYIPLATVVSAVVSRLLFNVAIDSLAGVLITIKLFLVGL